MHPTQCQTPNRGIDLYEYGSFTEAFGDEVSAKVKEDKSWVLAMRVVI